MGPVVGRSAKYMTAKRPEGTLSNLLADILVWAAKDYNEKPDFGVYNMGGVRADLPKGDVTYGDVLDVAPFENKIAFTTLSGATVLADSSCWWRRSQPFCSLGHHKGWSAG